MSVEAQTSKRSKNLLSKKQSSPGTFKVEKPKKMKRSTKGSASEDKLLKKKIKKEPLNSDIEGMEFNVKVSPKKHVREDKLFKKQIKKESLNSDVEGMEFNVKGSQKKHLRGQENPVPSSSIKVEINVKKKKALSVKNGKAFVPNLKQDQAFEKKKKKRPLDAEGSEDAPSPKKAKFSPKKSSKFQSMSKKGFTAPANKFTTNSSGPSEKPDWSKVKEERQALREKRRAAERDADSYEVSIQAKKVLESIRSRKCPAAEQSKQLDTLYSLLKGKLLSVVYAHDMSRVVETMLKFAHTHKKSDLLSKIIKELIPEVLQMSKRKYATHVVRAMIAHSSPVDRAAIVKAFCGHCVKLLSHKIGNVVLEQLYVKCKPEEQSQLFRELYGGSQKLISSEPVTGLEVIFKNLPNMKESTLTNTKEVLTGLFEKNVVHSQMIHSVLLDYLSFATPDESSEMLGLARNHIKALTQSKDGVHVAMMCVWMGSSKERKKIIKDLKEGVVALANGEHTHMLLLAIFDSMDDTVLVQKALLTELLAGDLKPLLSNTYGRKVLMYLCSRRDPKMFSSPIVATLATGDSNPHSKKDANVRALELQKFAVPFILEHIAQNTNLWMENNSNLLILLAAIKVGFGNHLPSALKAIASHVVSPPNSEKEGVDLRIADNTGCHMILKKLAQHDKVATENGHASFGEALLAELTDQHYQAWLGNNHCCFLLLEVLKNSPEEVSRSLQSKIKSHSASVWKRKESIPAGGKRILEVL